MAVAIIEDNKVVYNKGFGSCYMVTCEAATVDQQFRAASLSKMFVSTVVFHLIGEHRLSLKSPLSRYTHRWPRFGNVTLEQLLSNRSGIRDFLTLATPAMLARSITPTELISLASKASLEFSPGSRYAYSNTNFVLLGLLVETITKQSLSENETRLILKPCDMQSSFFERSPKLGIVNRMVKSSAVSSDRALDASWLFAAGDLVTTTRDLAKFDVAFMNGLLLDGSALHLISSGGSRLNSGTYYTLGFIRTDVGVLNAVGHHGGMPGVAAEDEMFLKNKFAIIVLGNKATFSTSAVYSAVFSKVCPINLLEAFVSKVFTH